MVLFTVFKQFDTRVGANAGHMAYSEFLDEVRNNRIRSAIIQEGPGGSTKIVATTNDDRKVRTTATYLDRGLVGDLINSNVKFDVKPREGLPADDVARQLGPDVVADRRVDLFHAPDARRRQGGRLQLR